MSRNTEHVKLSEQGGPYVIKTFAGWTVVGPLQPARNESYLRCSRISMKEVNTDVSADQSLCI